MMNKHTAKTIVINGNRFSFSETGQQHKTAVDPDFSYTSYWTTPEGLAKLKNANPHVYKKLIAQGYGKEAERLRLLKESSRILNGV